MSKHKLSIVGLIILLLGLSACQGQSGEVGMGQPDRTGSWAQINQTLERDANWELIVQDSEFQLGERSLKGSWNVGEGTEDYYEIQYGSYPCIDGSTIAVSMAVEFARQHLGLSDEDAAELVSLNTTHQAYVNLIEGGPHYGGMIRSTTTFLEENHPLDLIIATEPSDEELAYAAERGMELVTRPVCYDAFVFITHRDNPVDSLTVEQVRRIYTGQITNWSEVGGEDAPIIAYQREANSGSQTAMENLVMQRLPMLPPTQVKVMAGMGMLIEAVAEYQNKAASLGYTYQYYINTLYQHDDIKVLKIDGVAPDTENLKTWTYPFTTYYHAVIRGGEENHTGGRFVDWMLSQEGQRCIAQAGYIPL